MNISEPIVQQNHVSWYIMCCEHVSPFFLPYSPTDNKSKLCDAEKNNISSQYSNNLYILSLLNDCEPYY